jgi:hypothetical protein
MSSIVLSSNRVGAHSAPTSPAQSGPAPSLSSREEGLGLPRLPATTETLRRGLTAGGRGRYPTLRRSLPLDRPKRQSEPRVLEFARGSGPAAGSVRARDHGGGRPGQRPPRDANAHVRGGAQRGASHASLQVGDLLVWRVWAEEHLAGQR